MTVKIGSKSIGPGQPCYVIGEIGLNHNGDVNLAKKIIDSCVEAGVDCVKLQKRNVAGLATNEVLDAADNRFPEFGKTYREVRNHIEFDENEYADIINYCKKKNITFLCTAFDIPSVEFLEKFNVEAYKIASHSVTNLPLLRKLAEVGKPVIISSGMCYLEELDQAINILKPKVDVVLLHCVSSYPQPPEESNLQLMDVYAKRYQLPIGYSGHEIGHLPTLVSVARGACVVERHVTLDTKMMGFDHKLSLDPPMLKKMVEDIRLVEKIIGSGQKSVSEKEQITRNKYHVSMVSSRNIRRGEVFTEAMFEFKNPGTGLPPSKLKDVVSKKASRDIPKDTLISLEMVEG